MKCLGSDSIFVRGFAALLLSSLALEAAAYSLALRTQDTRPGQAAVLAFGCFQGMDFHLRFDGVPLEQRVPVQGQLSATLGPESRTFAVALKGFRLAQEQEVGTSLPSAFGVWLQARAESAPLNLRLTGTAVPLAASFPAPEIARLQQAAGRCR